MPWVPLGDAPAYLEQQANAIFPRGVRYDFKGEGTALEVTFFQSLLIINLVLSAQFESWRDPFVIFMSVPVTIAGAMAFMFLGFATVNIYTQVGVITLIGLVAKNGILIVEFSNQSRERVDDPPATDPDDHGRHGATTHRQRRRPRKPL